MSKKILIIDDEGDFQDMLKIRLKANDFTVLSAYDGEEGLSRVRSDNPDLIILDVNMPKMDGYSFVRELKSDEEVQDIPIIVLSAKAELQDKFKREGIDHYLVKPTETEELLTRINKVLE